jgi:hypothetical protein
MVFFRWKFARILDDLIEGGLIIYMILNEDVLLENFIAICSGWKKLCFYGWP